MIIGLSFGLIGGLSFGLFGGLLVGLGYGGEAWLRHYALRMLLVRQGAIFWRYVHFLDHAAQRILLRKVGGGYIFIHQLLLDYFAKQYRGPETNDVSTVSSVQTKQEQ